MTEQEVIKYLKGGCLGLNCEYHIKDRCKDDFEAREKKKADAIILSIKALEKQIAKKPIWKTGDFINRHHCPCCNEIVWIEHPYCKCGQKLDWGNEDAE